MSPIHQAIYNVIAQITPFDATEKLHRDDALAWISSGEQIFRVAKPATPPKHLVCYTVLADIPRQKILLLEHKKALLLLPPGGHVEVNELPHLTVERELQEELGEQADFWQWPLSKAVIEEPRKKGSLGYPNYRPFFITQVTTVGLTAGHTDVDLWYILNRDSTLPINEQSADFTQEFGGHYWLTFAEILATDIGKLDPNMHRLVRKLEKAVDFKLRPI